MVFIISTTDPKGMTISTSGLIHKVTYVSLDVQNDFNSTFPLPPHVCVCVALNA